MTFTDPGRLQNAIAEARATLRADTNLLPADIRARALANIAERAVQTRTVGFGSNRVWVVTPRPRRLDPTEQ